MQSDEINGRGFMAVVVKGLNWNAALRTTPICEMSPPNCDAAQCRSFLDSG